MRHLKGKESINSDQQIKEKLASTGQELKGGTNRRVITADFWLKGGLPAAAIIVFLLVGYIILNQTDSNQKLFSAYYNTYPNVIEPIERSNSVKEKSALAYYENGNYEKARELLEKEIVKSPGDIGIQFYFSIRQLELDNVDFAILDLEAIADSDNLTFKEPATWYLVLAYLKTR